MFLVVRFGVRLDRRWRVIDGRFFLDPKDLRQPILGFPAALVFYASHIGLSGIPSYSLASSGAAETRITFVAFRRR